MYQTLVVFYLNHFQQKALVVLSLVRWVIAADCIVELLKNPAGNRIGIRTVNSNQLELVIDHTGSNAVVFFWSKRCINGRKGLAGDEVVIVHVVQIGSIDRHIDEKGESGWNVEFSCSKGRKVNNETDAGRHSSVDSSAPTIFGSRVRIPRWCAVWILSVASFIYFQMY